MRPWRRWRGLEITGIRPSEQCARLGFEAVGDAIVADEKTSRATPRTARIPLFPGSASIPRRRLELPVRASLMAEAGRILLRGRMRPSPALVR